MKMVTNFAVLVVAIAIASTDGFNTNLNSRALATSYGNVVPSTIVSSSMSATIFNAKKDCNLSLRMATLDMEIEDSKQSRSCFRKVRQATENAVKKSKSKVSAFRGWTKKQRAKSLTTALVFFSTILSFTHTEQANYQTLGDSPSSAVVRQVASNDHLQTQLASRGGRSEISSSSPTQSMRDLLSKTKSAATNALSMNGGAKAKAPEVQITEATTRTFKSAFEELNSFMKGPKSDTLLLLLATALITPICKIIGTSPIIGFLAAGMALGPNALGLISGIHSTETLAELGIVFFLFEMGIELSVERLTSMKKDVFGLGLCQFVTTAAAIALAGSFCNLPANALVVLGGGLALSSSAFVLQLLKDNNQMATRFGKASFGVLLFQDLAVVPLLVVTPILAGGGQGLASALGSAVVKAGIALTSIFFAGRVILNPLFNIVAKSKSQEAFLGVVLLTVLSMSFLTEGLGLSNTLGAFLAGVLLSETKYRYQIEADIAPFRGILLGLFFVTVGFEIDLGLIASNLPLVSSIVAAIVLIKTTVLTALSKSFGLSLSNSLQTGLMLSQGGEFAFVAFGLARSLGILDPATTKLLLTSVALTMAITPTLAALGGSLAKKMEEGSDFTHYLGQDSEANEIRDSNDFAIVVGYGKVGRLVCELLDKKLFNYVGLELNPNKAIEARNKGLPVFYGDIGRPEVAEAFGADKANAIILTISDKAEINRAVISLRRAFPDKRIFARAVDADHAERLQRTLDVIAMVPVVPEDSILLSLPFGGAVLRSLGAEREEVNAILEQTRKEILSTKNLGDYQEKDIVLEQLVVKKLDESSKKEKKKDGSKDDTSKSTTDNIEEEKKPTMVEQVIKTMTEDIEVEKRKEQMDRDTSDEVTAEELIAEEEEENGGGQQTKDEAAGLKT